MCWGMRWQSRTKILEIESKKLEVVVFFFLMYDADTDTTVPVPVDNLGITDEQELEFITDDTIRKVWNPISEEWYFSIVDVCSYLTDSDYQHARNYWKVLKSRTF